MGKIKNFLSSWLNEELWGLCAGFCLVALFTLCIQYFVFWFGNMIHTSERVGTYLDIGLFIIWLIAIIPVINSADLFPIKGTMEKGRINVVAVWLIVVGIYAYILSSVDFWILALCLVMLLCNWFMLEKLNADTGLLSITVGASLIYCLSTYFALLFNGIEPATDTGSIITLLLVTLILWFKPAFE